MIRNTMLGLSLFALMTGSALAATPTSKHVSKPRTVAAAPAGDTAKDAPKADAPKTDAPKTEEEGQEGEGPEGRRGEDRGREGDEGPRPLPRRSNSASHHAANTPDEAGRKCRRPRLASRVR